MSFEEPDFETVLEERRKTAAEFIEPATYEELSALGEELFILHDHPWREPYFSFLEAHRAETFYKGHTGDAISFVYSRTGRKGFWYLTGATKGMGPIQERGLKVLEEITAAK